MGTQTGKEKRPKKKNLLIRLGVFAFMVYSVVTLLSMQVELTNRKQEVETLEQNIETQRVENKELERQLATGTNEENVEKIARDQLDYVYPDEEVYIDISGS